MIADLNSSYWQARYENNHLGWDIGYVSTPLKEYIDQLIDKRQRILIPGAGNSYEAEYLNAKGFKNVFVLDFAESPLANFARRVPSFPKENLIEQDFFDHSGSYDLILEQTFFCALRPEMRKRYITKMSSLMHEESKLAGVLFDIPLYQDRPPFGGSRKEYMSLFQNAFDIKVMERAYNSIPERRGTELFFILQRTKI